MLVAREIQFNMSIDTICFTLKKLYFNENLTKHTVSGPAMNIEKFQVSETFEHRKIC